MNRPIEKLITEPVLNDILAGYLKKISELEDRIKKLEEKQK